MKAKSYNILVRAIEEGFEYGWNRAHKHLENPSKEVIQNAINDAIINEICEYFSFDDEENERS